MLTHIHPKLWDIHASAGFVSKSGKNIQDWNIIFHHVDPFYGIPHHALYKFMLLYMMLIVFQTIK